MHVSAPKNKLPTDLRAQIAERKADILTLLRQRSSTKRIAAPPIKPRARSEPAPLSFAQERLWFLEQLEPQSVAYNICRASRLFGNLNISALQASLNDIISRHETLRTALRLVDGRPVQLVQPARNISIEIADFSSMPTEERDAEIQRRIKAEAECPFDLSAGPLLRSTLLRAGDQEHVLILMTHHSASDAWSMGIITRDLWTLYEAFSNGKPSPFARLPVQYSDYAVWQRNWLQGEVLDTQLDYWKKQLENLSIVNLPTDRPRTPRQSFRGARVPITLPQALTASLNELSNRLAVTPFMTLLAAFQVLLFRYTGQEDIAVGSPIANRRRPEVDGLIGFFVNTLVLRADLSENPSFRKLLSRVKDTCVAADANQDLPFEKLVQELQPERDLSRNPLFQVMFVLQNATSPFRGITGLRVEPIELEATRSPFDLSLFLREREGKYIGYIEYSTDLFNRDRIERMAGHFQTLLEAIVADPDQAIATLPILTEAERHRILVEWNDTAADYPKDKCIHQLFEEQVERTPDAIALEFEDKKVTYRELNQKANQLARHLVSLGIGPDKLVGICVERSIEIVVGLLGILKAGGAYVPLDPSYPKERLRFMLEDANISVLVTQENLLDRTQDSTLSTQHSPVCLDRDLPMIEQQSSENPTTQIDSDNLAYVIYTSGSTGTPKGVAIEHRNTVALLNWARSVFTDDEITGVLASTSICFDLSVFELFVPLSLGGKIILVENALSLRATDAKGITLVNTVPSAMAALLAARALPDSVRVVNLAGEPLRPELVNQIYRTGTVEKVYDLYGPSETTTYSTFTRQTATGPATIGRPISNTQIYLLDSNLQPVPIGVPGELYIAGAGVARGYLHRPELTAEKFISDPFSDNSSSRVYWTGDFARYLPDGNIEFLGRIDNQAKIRGYRIELGEIEATLNLYPAVRESIVVAHERQDAYERELVGYVVLDKALASGLNDVRTYLATKLPAFMIPNVLVSLDVLPVTPNGKIDRSKLPSPEESPRGLNTVPIPPRSELEELVANIWRDILQIDNLSVHDNFFALGGHSLLAIQIVSRLQEAFNKEVPLRLLFDAPTIAELGQELETVIRDGHAPKLPPIARVPRNGPLPLSMNQEHLWYLDQMMPGTHFFNMPYVYQLSGELNVEALEKALSEIIRRHEALRTVFKEIDGRPVQIIKDGSDIQLAVIDLRSESLDESSEKASSLMLEERQSPINLTTGPLVRAKLIRLTDTESFLLLTLHHIISDHWSMQILRRELASVYDSVIAGVPLPLPEPQIQFADYAVWERQILADGLLRSHLDYWLEKLALPTSQLDIAAKPSQDYEHLFHRSVETIDLDPAQFGRIRSLAGATRCTPFMIITAALGIFLHQLSGQCDIRIGTLISNRRRKTTEFVVGYFLNTIVLCLRIGSRMTFGEYLAMARETILVASSHQELPFEYLARKLETIHDTSRDGLFRVLIIYNQSFRPMLIPGLTLDSFILDGVNVQEQFTLTAFDMIINLHESTANLSGSITFNPHAFEPSVISSLNAFLATVIDKMMNEPNQTVSLAEQSG